MTTHKTPRPGAVIRLGPRQLYVLGAACADPRTARTWREAEHYPGWRAAPSIKDAGYLTAARTTGWHVQDLDTGEVSTLPTGRYPHLDDEPYTQTERDDNG